MRCVAVLLHGSDADVSSEVPSVMMAGFHGPPWCSRLCDSRRWRRCLQRARLRLLELVETEGEAISSSGLGHQGIQGVCSAQTGQECLAVDGATALLRGLNLRAFKFET